MTDEPYFLSDFKDASATEAKVILWLRDGVTIANHPFRFVTLASIGADGAPTARLLVLRDVFSDRRIIEVHTDIRSPKVSQLKHHPEVCLLFYDPALRFQLRIAATATLHHKDDVARTAWQHMRETSRSTYSVGAGPGFILQADDTVENPIFDPQHEEAAFGNFVAIRCVYHEMDLVELHPTGNRRALLTWVVGYPKLQRIAP